MIKQIAAIVVIACSASVALAQGKSHSGCNVPARLTYPAFDFVHGVPKNRVVSVIYDLNRAQQVISSGQCSCEVWHPRWDAALGQFEKDFMQTGGTRAHFDQLQAQSSELFTQALRICSSQGVH